MSDATGNKTVSAISAILSIAGLILLLSVLAGVWNYSVGPTIFIASAITGAAGTIAGFVTRRAGASALNTTGLWLGLLDVVAVVLLMAFYTFEAA